MTTTHTARADEAIAYLCEQVGDYLGTVPEPVPGTRAARLTGGDLAVILEALGAEVPEWVWDAIT